MGRTVNRRPQLIDTPSSKAIATSYFHQNEWKGICEDKNTFGVDQNTFAECENVYVDRDNILANRPGLSNIHITDDVNNYFVYATKSYILYVGDTGEDGKIIRDSKIINVKNSIIDVQNLELPHTLSEQNEKISEVSPNTLYFYEIGNTLFCFAANGKIYKLNENYELVSAATNIYLPIVDYVRNKLMPDGVEGTYSTHVEGTYSTHTEFANSVYTELTGQNKTLYEQSLKIIVNGVQYSWPYDSILSKYGFLNKLDIDTSLFNSNNTLIIHDNKPWLLDYSGSGITLKSLIGDTDISVPSGGSTVLNVPYFDYKSSEDIYFCNINDRLVSSRHHYDLQINYYNVPDNNTSPSNLYKIESDIFYESSADEFGRTDIRNVNALFLKGLDSSNNPELYILVTAISHKYNVEDIKFVYSSSKLNAKLYKLNNYGSAMTLASVFVNPIEIQLNVDSPAEADKYSNNFNTGYGFYIKDEQSSSVDKEEVIRLYTNKYYLNGNVVNSKGRVTIDVTNQTLYVTSEASIIYYNFINDVIEDYVVTDTMIEVDNISLPNTLTYNGLFGTEFNRRYFDSTGKLYTNQFVYDKYDNDTSVYFSIGCTFHGTVYDVYWQENYDNNNSNRLWVYTSLGIYVSDITGLNDLYTQSKDVKYSFSYKSLGSMDAPSPVSMIRPIGNNTFLYFVKDASYILQVRYNNSILQLYMPEDKENQYYDVVIDAEQTSDKSLVVIGNNVMYSVVDTGEVDDKLLPVFQYIRSKLNLRVIENSDSIVAYNSSTILMPTYNGMAAVNYNQLISVEEQVVNYITDNIMTHWFKFVATESDDSHRIKTCNHNYYLLVYHTNRNDLYMFDYRTNTWWYWTFDKNIQLLHTIGLYCFIVFEDNSFYYFDEKVLDAESPAGVKNWSITSQKLFLGNNTNYKQIRRFTVHTVGEKSKDYSYQSGDGDNVMKLQFTNYRKRMYENDDETFNFNVDFVRTYVIRLNYPKVYEFQYKLSSNELNLKPLQLTGITIEYKVGGKVR